MPLLIKMFIPLMINDHISLFFFPPIFESACISNVRNEYNGCFIKGVPVFVVFWGGVLEGWRAGVGFGVLGFVWLVGFFCFLFRTFAFFCGLNCDLYVLYKAWCVIWHGGQLTQGKNIFFLIEEASNLPLVTQKGDPAGNITVYIIILRYCIFEWNSSVNYFKYTCSCNSNISVAPFCLT